MLASPALLAFDTSTGPCSVAVWKGGKVASFLKTDVPVMQSARLVPMIEQALKESHTDYKHLTAIAATVGPGSFTGIRVGLAAARGICFAAGLKGIGLTTLETIAFGAHKEALGTPILVILNAGKGEFYLQGFAVKPSWQPLFEPRVGSLESAVSLMQTDFVTAGNATIQGHKALSVTCPQADALAELATLQHDPVAALKPFYIRPPDATPLVKKPETLL